MTAISAASADSELSRCAPAAPQCRGRTTIADQVVEKIAAHTLSEVDAAGGMARRFLGVPLGRDAADTAPRVSARIEGELAMLQIRISVVYPAPIREVTRRVRAHVAARVGELTGLQVRQVDISIARLTRAERSEAGTDSEESQAPEATPRRAERRAFGPQRTFPAVLTAAALATAATLVVAEVITALLFHHPANVLPVAGLARLGRDTRWDDPLALAVAAIVAVLGLLLFLLALTPGRRRAIALASDDSDTVVGITVRGLRRQIARAATSVDGITHARVGVGRRSLRVRATSPLRDTHGLAEQVRGTITERLEELKPLHPPRLHVTVRCRKD